LTNDSIKAAVLTSRKPGCFIAGADIGWLDSATSKQEVGEVLDCLEVQLGLINH